MNRFCQAVEVVTDAPDGSIVISQDQDVITLSPEQIDLVVSWMKMAQAEIIEYKLKHHPEDV